MEIVLVFFLGLLGLGIYLLYSLSTYPAKQAKRDAQKIIDRELNELGIKRDKGELTDEEYDLEVKKILLKWSW